LLIPTIDSLHYTITLNTYLTHTAVMSTEQRGRDPVVSTGRGGAGNLIRSPSRGVDPDVQVGAERGRSARDQSLDRVIHSGRGGAGNIRSPSRNPSERIAEERAEEDLQDRLIAESRGRQTDANFSTGRGGAGNISRSKSRSRSAVRGPSTPQATGTVHASGRGGFGNIEETRESMDEEKREAMAKYEREVVAKHKAENGGKPVMTGKGGMGNYAQPGADVSNQSLQEREAYAKVHAHDKGQSTGRGGGGNFHGAGERGRVASGGDKPGVFGNIVRSLSRAAGRDKSSDRPRD